MLCFSIFSINAAPFNTDQSNSVNKFSLLKISSINGEYFVFDIDVMQKNNWDFRSDIHLFADNFEKKIKADFNDNTLSFTLTNDEYMEVVNSEYLTVKSFLQYEDSFHMPVFRDSPEYKELYSELFKKSFLVN